MTTKELHELYEVNVYPSRGITLVKGKDALLWDDDGKEYIDCASGIGVANIGHANKKITQALIEQSQKLITCPGVFYNDIRAKLLEKLVSISPQNLSKVFLCNSGTEAVEAAIKFTRLTTGKKEFICAMKSFHGRTFGALSATFKAEYREGFEPLVPGFKFAPFNNYEKFAELVTDDTAGIILEIVQGEGGINIGEKDFFNKIQKLCNERNILLIIDEIQTGFCRTGKLFASDHYSITPDILCLAKSIAGGFPMGAVLCSDKISVTVGKHGSTFGGNPLACAAALASIDFMIENKLADQAAENGNYFLSLLNSIESNSIRNIRGLGLMIGIELKSKVQPVLVELMDKGIIALPAGTTVLRLLPPLTIEKSQLYSVYEKLKIILRVF